MSNRGRAGIRIAGPLLAGALILSACGGDGAGGAADVEDAIGLTIQRNQGQWALPLDAYDLQLWDSEENRAFQSVLLPCLAGRGYELGSLPPARSSVDGIKSNLVSRKLFNEALAERYGYGGPKDPTDPAATEPSAEQLAALDTPAGKEANDVCVREARGKVPVPPRGNLLFALRYAAYESAKQQHEVVEAVERWRACMAPLGQPDLPAWPEEAPGQQTGDAFIAARADDPQGNPSAAEVEAAVFDAQCQKTSGFADAMYDTEWELQLASIPENLEALEGLRQANEEYAVLIRAVLAESGLTSDGDPADG
jgi:hypothetical protein